MVRSICAFRAVHVGVAQDAWKKRKRIVVEAVAIISEGANKKPAELYEKIGIETDEEAVRWGGSVWPACVS